MALKYFNKLEFEKALSYADINPIVAKKMFEEYLNKYPKDYSAYSYYAYVLIILGEFTNAEKILDFMEKEANKDSNFNNDFNKVRLLKQNIIFSRLKILTYQEKFEELYQLYMKNSKILKNICLSSVIFYSKKKLGQLDPNKREINSYLFRQIVEYKYSDFLEHIQKHLADYNINLDKRNETIFTPAFPINTVLKELDKYIPSNQCLHPGFFEDVYVFKYNECGRENNKMVDYFKVVCFHNTKDFVTMFPSAHCEELPYVDLNYLINEKQEPKIKRLTQIEKFNRKYSNN